MANWITDELFRLLYADGEGQGFEADRSIRACSRSSWRAGADGGCPPDQRQQGKKVLESMYGSGDDPQTVVEREGLAMVSNTSVIDAAVQDVFDSNPDELARYRSGEKSCSAFSWAR